MIRSQQRIHRVQEEINDGGYAISVLVPDSYYDNLLTWDPMSYLRERSWMVMIIYDLLKNHHYLLSNQSGNYSSNTLPFLAQRIELCLCVTSSTFKEYINCYSLRRRLHSLVILLLSKNREESEKQSSNSQRKRKRESELGDIITKVSSSRSSISVLNENTKLSSSNHCRLSPASNLSIKRHRLCSVENHQKESILLLNNQEDVLIRIFSFLDGMEIIRTYSRINHCAHRLPTHCIKKLLISNTVFHQAFHNPHGRRILSSLKYLETLNVYNSTQFTRGINTKTISLQSTQYLHAQTCLQPHYHSSEEEGYVEEISTFLSQKCYPKLRSLQLNSLFCSSVTTSGTYMLTKVLKEGACPQLEVFSFSGNSIRDDGAMFIADLLESAVGKKLRVLDLRRNFIGSRGFRSITTALQKQKDSSMEILSVGGNILVDCSMEALNKLFESGNCTKLNYLGIEMNFLGEDGIRTLGNAVGLSKKLNRIKISYGDNSISNENARELLRTTVVAATKRTT